MDEMTGMPPLGAVDGQGFWAELERDQATVKSRAPAASQVGGHRVGVRARGEWEPVDPPGPGLSPSESRLPASPRYGNRGTTSLNASGAEPLPHHVIA